MKIPNYIIALLNRSEYFYGDLGSAGYTLKIHKATPYTHMATLKSEVDRLIKWANKQFPTYPEAPTAKLECGLGRTMYCDQSAIVTIYDPVMKHIEQYIHYNPKSR